MIFLAELAFKSDRLLGTSANTTEALFQMDVPNGAYLVTVRLGSTMPSEGRDGQCVSINGHQVLPPPGVGGWGKLVTRILPAVAENGVLKIRFYTPKEKSTQRLNLYSMQIRSVSAAEEAGVRAEFSDYAPGKAVVPREVIINGKKINEVGRRPRKEPPRYTAEEIARKAVFFSPDFSGAILNDTVPERSEIKNKLSAFAAPDEVQSFFAGLHAIQNVKVKNVKISPLKNAQGDVFGGKTDLYSITCIYRSPFDTINFDGRLAPELLERNFSFELSKGMTQPFYFTVTVPENQKEGVYRGILTAETDGGNVNLPFELTVLDMKLEKPEISFLIGADTTRWRGMSPDAVRNEITDMAAHGFNGLLTPMAPIGMPLIEDEKGEIAGADFDRYENYLRLAHDLGMDNTLLMSATNQLLWFLPNWEIHHRNGDGTHRIEKYFTVEHKERTSMTHLQNINFLPLFSPRRYRYSITYQSTGNISAQSTMEILDQMRNTVRPNLILRMPPTRGELRTVEQEIEVENPAALHRHLIRIQGDGKLALAEIRLIPLDNPALNMIGNSRFLRTIDKADWNKPWNPEFVRSYRKAIRANADAARKLGFTPVFFGTDEAGNNPKNEYKEIRELDEVKKAGEDTFCNMSPALGAKTLEQLTIACFYADLLGNFQSAEGILDFYHKNGKKVYAISAGTYAGQNFSIMVNRYNTGFFAFRNQLDGLWFWTFQRPNKDPFDDFDSRTKDYCLVYPPRSASGEPVKSIAYEGIREGIRDYRYLQTLKNAISEARKNGRTQDADNGQMILDCILKAIPEYGTFNEYTFNDRIADQLRELAAIGIASFRNKTVFSGNPQGKAEMRLSRLKTSEAPPVKQQIVPAFDAPCVLDGKLDEPQWHRAMRIAQFYDYVRGTPVPGTEAYFYQDDKFLYIGVKAQAPAGKKPLGSGDENAVFANDHFEIMLDDKLDRHDWFQLAFDEFGNKADLKCVGSRNSAGSIFAVNYGGAPNVRDMKWNCDFQVKVNRQKNYWSAECAIPLNLLGEGKMRHGMLIGRSGFGATVSNKAIGFFDQVEKYPVITLAGSRAKLQSMDLAAYQVGRQLTNFKFGSLSSGKVVIREIDSSQKASDFSAPIRSDGSAAVYWRLSAKSRKIVIRAIDSDGKCAWEMEDTFQLLAPLEVTAPERVFFDKNAAFVCDIRLQASSDLRKNGKMIYTLRNSRGIIGKKEGKAANQRIEIPLRQLADGFYLLKIELSDGRNSVFAEEINFGLVPGIKK